MTRVMHFEDNAAASEITRISLEHHLPDGVEYLHHDTPYCACPQIAIKDPDVLICDYQFEHSTLKSGLIDGIKSFKGPVYVLSSHAPSEIRRLVPELPDSVRVYQKGRLLDLISDLKRRA